MRKIFILIIAALLLAACEPEIVNTTFAPSDNEPVNTVSASENL